MWGARAGEDLSELLLGMAVGIQGIFPVSGCI